MKSRVALLASLLAVAGSAMASSSYSTGDTISDAVKSVSNTASSSGSDDKVILQAARDDAASFVATGGGIRGPHLEAALRRLRERMPEARLASDEALARAILAL